MEKASKKPIRVLQIGMHETIGGVETYLMNYYRNINKSKVQFDFVCPYKKLCFEDEIRKTGGKVYKVSNFKKKPIRFYKEIKEIIKSNDYKIIHNNMLSPANIIPLIAAKKAGANKIIAHAHNSNCPRNPIKKTLTIINRYFVYKYSTDFFSCSQKAANWFFGRYNKKRGAIIINNAIDLGNYSYSSKKRRQIRNQYGIKDEMVIGNIGRFCKEKNQLFLINVLKALSEQGLAVTLLLIGDGKTKKALMDFSLNRKLNVIFTGNVSNIQDYLSAMDLFVMPSIFEGFPVTGVEAQANGLPCIFSKNITQEMRLLKTTVFLDLDKGAENWANIILKMNTSRANGEEIARALQEYDILKNAIKLEHFYEKYKN
jgi:glycosyltransferase involved in cell wall biosynthesis